MSRAASCASAARLRASSCAMAVRAAWTLQLPDSAPAPGSLEVALPTQDLADLRAALEDARKQLNGVHSVIRPRQS